MAANAIGRVVRKLLPLYGELFVAFAVARWSGWVTEWLCSLGTSLVSNASNPTMIFHLIGSRLDLGNLDYQLLAADVVSKVIIFVVILAGIALESNLNSHSDSLGWFISSFTLSTQTNAIVVGVPVAEALYGPEGERVAVELALLQTVVWSPLVQVLLRVRQLLQPASSGSGSAASGNVELQEAVTDDGAVVPRLEEAPVERDHVIDLEVADDDVAPALEEAPAELDHVVDVEEGDHGAAPGIVPLELEHVVDVEAVDHGPVPGLAPVELHHVDDAEVTDHSSVPGLEEAPVELDDIAGEEAADDDVAPRRLSIFLDQVTGFPKVVIKFSIKVLANPNILAAVLGVLYAAFINRSPKSKLGYLASSIESFLLLVLEKLHMNSLPWFLEQLPMIITGLSVGLHESIIACDLSGFILGQILKFVLEPIAMTIASKLVGLHGATLRVAIIQAAVPQAITSFIFAKQYRLHPEVVGTAVSTGMFMALVFLPLYDIILWRTM